MLIEVTRKWFTDKSTIGELRINSELFCFTLEDKDRGLLQTDSLLVLKAKKIFGVTAIPKGTYEVIMSYSNRFQKYLPQLLNVPAYEGVRIHAGNFAENTEGCLLLGYQREKDSVHESRRAVDDFIKKIQAVEKSEKITITIQ